MNIKSFIWMFIIIWCFWFLVDSLKAYDNTDDVVRKKRSGLALYTDNLTGCQYVKGGYFGGTTPRLGRNGDQIGCR